jgi:hypothetical protein
MFSSSLAFGGELPSCRAVGQHEGTITVKPARQNQSVAIVQATKHGGFVLPSDNPKN